MAGFQTIQQEATMAGLRRKHNDAITEMAEQIDQLNKSKAKYVTHAQTYRRTRTHPRTHTRALYCEGL